jgi:hypothetical protein
MDGFKGGMVNDVIMLPLMEHFHAEGRIDGV